MSCSMFRDSFQIPLGLRCEQPLPLSGRGIPTPIPGLVVQRGEGHALTSLKVMRWVVAEEPPALSPEMAQGFSMTHHKE